MESSQISVHDTHLCISACAASIRSYRSPPKGEHEMPSSANTVYRVAFPLLLERFVSRTSFGEHVACLRYPSGADDRSRSCEETTCWSWSLRCLPDARHSIPHLLHIPSSGIETPFYNVIGSRPGPQLRLHPPDFLFRFIDTTGSDGRSIGGRIAPDFSASKDVRESGDQLRMVGLGCVTIDDDYPSDHADQACLVGESA